jgi:hypothetical protein
MHHDILLTHAEIIITKMISHVEFPRNFVKVDCLSASFLLLETEHKGSVFIILSQSKILFKA